MDKEAPQVFMVADIKERRNCCSRVSQIEEAVNKIVGSRNWFRYIDEPWQEQVVSDSFNILIIDKTTWFSPGEVETLRRIRQKQPGLYVIFATNRGPDREQDKMFAQSYTRDSDGHRPLVNHVILGEFTEAEEAFLQEKLRSFVR